jgi:flavorubredoxin
MQKIRIQVSSDVRTEEIMIVRNKKRIIIDTENRAVARKLTSMIAELFEDKPCAIGFKDE